VRYLQDTATVNRRISRRDLEDVGSDDGQSSQESIDLVSCKAKAKAEKSARFQVRAKFFRCSPASRQSRMLFV
jgi:hypothetical protein